MREANESGSNTSSTKLVSYYRAAYAAIRPLGLPSIRCGVPYADTYFRVGVMNEPDNRISSAKLVSYYRAAYAAIRQAGMPSIRCDVLFPAYQRELSQFEAAGFPDASMIGAVMDIHMYQCFGSPW